MSDNATGTGGNETGTAQQQTPEAPKAGAKGNVADLPDWAQSMISDLRSENADKRAKHKLSQSQVDEYANQVTKLTDEKAAVAANLTAKELELTKFQIAVDSKIPGESMGDFVAALNGSNADELAASAELLSKHWNVGANNAATDHSQARGGNANTSPQSAFGDFVHSKLYNK